MASIMICLTRLNSTKLAINSDLIKFVENAPDTVVTLTTGEKLMVLESMAEIVTKVVEFRRRLFGLSPVVASTLEAAVDAPCRGLPTQSLDSQHV